MALAAQKVNLPIKIELPLLIAQPLRPCVLLGLGDMVFPGFYLNFLYRFSKFHKSEIYYIQGIFFYSLALTICGASLVWTEEAQPALFYISPLLLIPTIVIAYRYQEHKKIWKGLDNDSYDIGVDALLSNDSG